MVAGGLLDTFGLSEDIFSILSQSSIVAPNRIPGGLQEHLCWTINAEIQNAEMSDLLDAPTQDNEDNDYWDELEPETITERIALFLATLKSKSAQTYSTVSFVVQQTSSLISDIVGSLQRKTLSLFGKLGQKDDPRVQELVHDFEEAACPFKGLQSDYKQMQYFVKSGNFPL